MTSPSHLPEQPSPVSSDADLARAVALRMEQWFQQRQLALPPQTQAGFVEMGVEAVVRNPSRPREEVLDELVAELDARLAVIAADDAPSDATPGPAPPRSGLAGLFDRLRGRAR